MKKQVKSKERVAERGEVFTAEREVKAMCDLVATQCDNVDATFLEIIMQSLIQRTGIIKRYALAV